MGLTPWAPATSAAACLPSAPAMGRGDPDPLDRLCCAADATAYRVLTRDGPPLTADTWVSLTGRWVEAAGAPDGIPTLQVVEHELAQPPSNPYAG